MFVLNADGDQLVIVEPGATSTFDGAAAVSEGRVSRINLRSLRAVNLRGIAFNPQNGNLYFLDAADQRLYEVTQSGNKVSEFDLSSLQIANPKNIVFAPSGDRTDDPDNQSLFLLQDTPSTGPASPASTGDQLIEVSLVGPMNLPGGTQILPASLVRVQDMSNATWTPSSPDSSGIDYWPARGRLITTDSEVEEMPAYWQPLGRNVFLASTSGQLNSTCTTYTSGAGGVNGSWNHYTAEPTGIAVNYDTNRLYITDDGGGGGRLFEINLGPDGNYCTSDDIVTQMNTNTDLEDAAYWNNTLFLAGGVDAEVFYFSLGANQVLGGGDDGAMQQFDTNRWGITDVEGIGFNHDAGTILISSSHGNGEYIVEVSPTGTLLRAYDVSFMGNDPRLHSDIAYAPSSQNAALKNVYIVSRGVDNGQNPNENDGKWWEIALSAGSGPTLTPSRTPTSTNTPTQTPSPTPSRTPTPAPNARGGDTTGVFRPSNGALYLKNSNTSGFADLQLNYGIGGDYPVVGDWDGNGTTTIGIYRNGSFYLRNSNTVGVADVVFPFGAQGDQPIAGDWNGDGIDTIGVYRSSIGTFFLRNSIGPGAPDLVFALGIPGDVGIVGDWNGDGLDTTGVFRPSNGALYLKNMNTTGIADVQINYGIAGDKPVTGDWNNDGIDTIGIYRNGTFHLRNSNTIGTADLIFALGIPGDHPIAGNWDGVP
jgi:hypothetical protein